MKLHFVTDGRHSAESLVSIITDVHKFADAIHIREKKMSADELVELVELLASSGVPKSKLIMNGRVDAAVRSGLAKVQLPSHGLPVKFVKEHYPYLGAGCSVHSAKEAIEREKEGADWLIAGHVFQTNSKNGLEPKGISFLQTVCESVSIPVYAIGGITPGVLPELKKLRIAGAAAMSYVFSADKPVEAAKELARKLKGGTAVEDIL
ncbi:thiamine phosphate synthase [Metabacillus sp. SLBN-84]